MLAAFDFNDQNRGRTLIAWHQLAVGVHRLKCHICHPDKRGDKSLGLTLYSDTDGLAHCFRCGYVEVYRGDKLRDQLVRQGKVPQPKPTAVKHQHLNDAGVALWQSTRPLFDDDSPAARYLRSRGCAIPRHSLLRWKPLHRHPSGYVGPALVALVVGALDYKPLTLHQTWLTHEGCKAPLDRPRLLLPNHLKGGGVVELAHRSNFNGVVGVAEGIESAATLLRGMGFVWCAIDAGNMAALPVVPGVTELVIAEDGDDAGRRAAAQLATRYTQAGVSVHVIKSDDGKDINDLVQGAKS